MDKRIENERENSPFAENFSQDIIESSQPSVVPKKRNRLDNCNSDKCIVGSLTTEFLKPVSSGEPRIKKLSLNSLESCVELGKKSSGNYLSKSVEKKDSKKRRIPFIVYNDSHSNRDYDIIVDEKPNYQIHVESNHTNHDEDRNKSKSKLKHRSSWDTSFPDFLSPIEIQRTDNAESKSEISKKDGKRKRKEKVEKKIATTTPAMIPDSASSSDDQTQETNDCFIASLNKGNTREHKKSRVGQTLSTSFGQEESYSSNTKHFRKFIPIPNSDRTSDTDRSKGLENDRDCSQDHPQSFEFVKAIRSEKLPTHTASNCNSPDISVDNLKMKPDVIGENKKHEAKEKVKRKKANTLLAMIHDVRSSSDSDNEIQTIDDCSIATLNEGNTREHNKPRVDQILSTGVKEGGSHSSHINHFRKFIPIANSNKTSDNDQSKDQGNDEDSSQDHRQGFEFVKAISPEKLPVDIASNCGSPNTSLDVIRKDRKHKSKEKVKKKKTNTLLAMIYDIRSSSDSDDEIKKIDDCFVGTSNKGNTKKRNKSGVSQILSTSFEEEESHSPSTKHFRKFMPIPNSNENSDTDRSKGLENDRDCCQDNQPGLQFAKTIRSERWSADIVANCSSPDISVEDLKTKLNVIRKDREHKSNGKVNKTKTNTLLAMIHDISTSSDSDNEIQKIDVDDCSKANLNKGNTREHNKSRVDQILSTRVKEEESYSSNTNHFRKSIPISNSDKTSDNNRSKDRNNDKDSSQDNQQGFEFVKAIESEKFPAHTASNCSSPNISVDNLKMKPDVIGENKKHEAEEKVKKKKSNTLLAMIHDVKSSSDSDNEIQMIDDCSIATLNEWNTRKHNKPRVGQILSTRVKEEGSHSSNTNHFRKFIPIPNSDKTSDNDRSKDRGNDGDSSQDHRQDFEFVKAISPEKLPVDIASNCGSPNISLDVIRKDRKHKSKEKVKKKKTNTLLAMIHDIKSSSDSDDEIKKIDDCFVETSNKGNSKKRNKSGVSQILSTNFEEEESHSPNTKHFRKFIPIPNSDKNSDTDRSNGLENDRDCCQDNQQGFVFVKAIKSKKLPTHTSSNCSSPNISVDNLKMKPDVIGEDRKHEAKEKVKKKKSSTLLAMIHDVRSSSDSDNEIQKIDDCPKATLNKGNTREHNKPKVGQILSTRVKEEGSHSPNTSHFRKFIPIPNRDKISDNDRSKDQGNDEDSSQDHRQGFEFVKAISPEKLPVDIASNCGSPNTSLDVIRKHRKHKSKEKVKKKKTNTLLAMIHDIRSSSDSDDEIKKIDDCSVKTLKERNTRKRNKSGVSQILSTSFGEEESHSSNTKHFRKFIPNPNSNRTSDNDRSKERENDEDSSQVNRQGFELVKAVESEKLPADTASNRSSPNISVEDLQMKPDVIRKNREHKANGKVKKKKTNTLLAMIHDISSSSDSDNEIQKIDDCSKTTLNKGNTREHNKSRIDQILSTRVKEEESYSSNTSHFRKFIPIPNSDKTSDNDRSKDRENDEDSSQDNQQGFEFVKTIKSEKLPTHTASNCSSPNISVDNLKMKPDVIGENKQHEAEEKVKKKKANTLLAMIHDVKSSSDSDNEIQTIDDCSIATLNEGNTREHNKPRVGQILSTRVKEEGSHSSHTNHFRKFIPIPNRDKISDNDRSKDQGNDEDSSQDHRQGFEFVKAISPEKLPADIASNCGSPNTSLDVIRKDRKHEAKEKVKRKKANTLQAMIHDIRSNSDLDDKIKEIDDSFEESVDKVNSRKSTKSRVNEIFEEEEGDESSREQPVENLSAIGRKFDLEVEAEDIEELISAIEERGQLPQETVTRLLELRVRLKHTVPPQHRIETYAGSRGPTPRQKKIIEKFGPIKYGKFAPGEDDIIVNNWKSFCELHDWDPSDYKPFLYMRHRKVGFIAKFSERLKFVQFLADGLPWRTLYSVYWRFRNLYQPHIHTKYTDEEDKLIIAHLENSSDKKNVRKYSELGKILNRTRSSVWKRYSLLSKKRNPCKKLEWNLHLVEKLIKNLIKLTLSNDVYQLKDLNIPLVVWKILSKKFKIDNLKLKLFWQKKLHMQLFCQEPVYMNDVKIKLIEYFHATGISESWEIEWASIAKNFDGMTTAFLSQIFCGLVRHEKYQGMKFGEIIGHLYEVKKPELQKNRNDKCLPRIVFKDGNVELLDVQADNRSKRKTVESGNSSN